MPSLAPPRPPARPDLAPAQRRRAATATRTAPPGPLAAPDAVELRPASVVAELGRTVVLAPHADDESLGCGGLLAHLADAGLGPRVVVVTDGTRSHPGSAAYPAPRLRALREDEARQACAVLGADVAFLRHPDCGLPAPGSQTFCDAAVALATHLADADTVVVPWRRDPHCDHEGTWRLARAAVAERDRPTRWLEYPVWAWTRPDGPEAPRADEAAAWRLDVSGALGRKRRAVAAHRSQTTALIADAPDGFRLAPEMLALFDRPYELFLDPRDV